MTRRQRQLEKICGKLLHNNNSNNNNSLLISALQSHTVTYIQKAATQDSTTKYRHAGQV